MPWLGKKILKDETPLECLWPDKSITTHRVKVTGKSYYVERLGRYPGDGYTSTSYKHVATITIEHRGRAMEIDLARAGNILCRLAPSLKKAKRSPKQVSTWDRLLDEDLV